MQDRSHLSLQMLKSVIFSEVGTWASDPAWAKLEAPCLDLKPEQQIIILVAMAAAASSLEGQQLRQLWRPAGRASRWQDPLHSMLWAVLPSVFQACLSTPWAILGDTE